MEILLQGDANLHAKITLSIQLIQLLECAKLDALMELLDIIIHQYVKVYVLLGLLIQLQISV